MARPLKLITPLGSDVLQVVNFSGEEPLSGLFAFELDLVARNRRGVPFDQLLGRPATIEMALPGGAKRHFNGIVSRFSQGSRGETLTAYRAELVPALWSLTRKAGSRIFQQISVPDLLGAVLGGLDVSYELQGTFQPRNYVVQYRESDFNFASRLMEEEGIYYFFRHSASGHTMVVANSPQSHPGLPTGSTIRFRAPGERRRGPTVFKWEKTQELRSGKYVLRDHHFQLPGERLEAEAAIQESVPVGGVTHGLRVGGNDKLEIYDYPGEYAQRFDGIDPGGGERPAELDKIFEDAQRTVAIRMQEEALPSLLITGASTARGLAAGHKFTLNGHHDGDGEYVLTGVRHAAELADPRDSTLEYSNTFTCIPVALPYRPPRRTPRPVVAGPQSAVVVGPAGEEIFTDKYGRVKVQFHWDREGRADQDSSCWIRVASLHAGQEGGFTPIPRIGTEVVVGFEEGDPDQPIIVGSVYNPDQPPPERQAQSPAAGTDGTRP